MIYVFKGKFFHEKLKINFSQMQQKYKFKAGLNSPDWLLNLTVRELVRNYVCIFY